MESSNVASHTSASGIREFIAWSAISSPLSGTLSNLLIKTGILRVPAIIHAEYTLPQHTNTAFSDQATSQGEIYS